MRRLALLLLLSGCEGAQSALDTHGPQAAQTLSLFRIFLIVAAVVWVLVVLALAVAILRRRGAARPPLALDARVERRTERIVTALTVLTAVIVSGLSIASYVTGRSLAAETPEALSIRVTGHQWWWEVDLPGPARRSRRADHRQRDPHPRRPAGAAEAAIRRRHPQFLGAEPARQAGPDPRPHAPTICSAPTRPACYRGQCAEFCGLQHAHMAL